MPLARFRVYEGAYAESSAPKKISCQYDFCLRAYADWRIMGEMANKPKFVRINATASGALGGSARAANLTPTQRKAASKRANKARWDKYYALHPEKIRPKRKRRAA